MGPGASDFGKPPRNSSYSPGMQVVRSPEVEAVARRIWESFAAGNKPAVANMMSKDPAARWVLTADYEWFGSDPTL